MVLHKLKNLAIHKSHLKGREYPNIIPFARSNFKNWLLDSTDEIQTILAKTQNEASYPGWIDWAIKEAWVDHSIRLNGLFNENMIKFLSPTLDVADEKLKNILINTRNPIQVKKWSEGYDRNADFELAREAYVASAILRGKFHEEVAYEKREGTMRHPIRQYMPIKSDKSKVTAFNSTLSLNLLVNIINKNSLIEKNPKKRTSLWIENIAKVREAYLNETLDESFYRDLKLEEEQAFKVVENTVEKLKLRLYPKYFEDIFEFMTIVGINTSIGFSSIYLNLPWEFSAGVGSTIGYGIWRYENETESFGRSLAERAERLARKENSLRDLAKAPPGLVIRKT
jgi:hypothetical protein